MIAMQPPPQRVVYIASKNPAKVKAAHDAVRRCFPAVDFIIKGATDGLTFGPGSSNLMRLSCTMRQ